MKKGWTVARTVIIVLVIVDAILITVLVLRYSARSFDGTVRSDGTGVSTSGDRVSQPGRIIWEMQCAMSPPLSPGAPTA